MWRWMRPYVSLVLALGNISCGGSDTPEWYRHAGSSAFIGPPPPSVPPFDVIASDVDLDGDPDLLINWHQYQLELFANQGGVFERINRPQNDRAGLTDNYGIPYLYADSADIVLRIRRSGAPGLYVWHDSVRKRGYYFMWRGEADSGLRLELEGNYPFKEIEGIADDEYERPDERRLRIAIDGGANERVFRVRIGGTTQLKLRMNADVSGGVPALFVGYHLTPIQGVQLDLWTPDAHGMAWVNVEGSRHPKLYMTRGALQGTLTPPLDGKNDRYYVHSGGGEQLYRMADPGVVPADYTRGRRVEWVDVDNDGTLEMSIGNKESSNRVLARDRDTGHFRDRAPELGLDSEGAEVQCWGDLDGDGFQDLFYLEAGVVHVARNVNGQAFERISGEFLGLTLPAVEGGKNLFRLTTLRLADVDNDGDLDLWVLAYGPKLSNHLFRRNGAGYNDVSERVGLTDVEWVSTTMASKTQ